MIQEEADGDNFCFLQLYIVNSNNLKDYDEHIKGINSFDKKH